MRGSVGIALVMLVAAPARGQQEFDEAYAAAQGATNDHAQRKALFARAVQAFETLEPASDGYADRLQAAGYAAWQIEDYRHAAEWFGAAIDSSGPTAWLVEWRIEALAKFDADAALRAAMDLRDANPTVVDRVIAGASKRGRPELLEAAGRLLRAGETDVGLAYFRGLVAASEDPIALGNLALALRNVGRIEECEAVYRRAVELDPNDHLLWNDLGLFYKGVGRITEAVESLQRSVAAEHEPVDGPATSSLAVLQRRGVAVGIEDPAMALARILRTMPDAALARRRCIDAILDS